MFVIDVTIPLFLSWQSLFMVSAILNWAFEGTRMRFLVFCKVAFSIEDLVTGLVGAFELDYPRFGVLLPPCHGPDNIVIHFFVAVLAFDAGNRFVRLVGSKRDAFAVLPPNKLGQLPSLA
jgi:hypothetical protein